MENLVVSDIQYQQDNSYNTQKILIESLTIRLSNTTLLNPIIAAQLTASIKSINNQNQKRGNKSLASFLFSVTLSLPEISSAYVPLVVEELWDLYISSTDRCREVSGYNHHMQLCISQP